MALHWNFNRYSLKWKLHCYFYWISNIQFLNFEFPISFSNFKLNFIEFQLDLYWVFIGIPKFNSISNGFLLVFHCNFNWINNWSHWLFIGSVIEFQLYLQWVSICISLKFQLDIPWISIVISLKFQVVFLLKF